MANRIFYIIAGRENKYLAANVTMITHGAYPNIKLAVKAFEQHVGWLCSHLHAEIVDVEDDVNDWKHTTTPLQVVIDFPNGERETLQLRWDWIYEN